LVSHHEQPTVQPWRRTKCAGAPADGPSPWSERNTSLMRVPGMVAGSGTVTGDVSYGGSAECSVTSAPLERELLAAVEALPGVGRLAGRPVDPVVAAAPGTGH